MFLLGSWYMPYKHKRKILKNAKELDRLEAESEQLTLAYLLGKITRDEYEKGLEKLNLYLDLRQLAVELQAV